MKQQLPLIAAAALSLVRPPGLLKPGDVAIRCTDAADANGDDRMDFNDAIYLISWLHRAGPKPAEPSGNCGIVPIDALDSCPNGLDSCQ